MGAKKKRLSTKQALTEFKTLSEQIINKLQMLKLPFFDFLDSLL